MRYKSCCCKQCRNIRFPAAIKKYQYGNFRLVLVGFWEEIMNTLSDSQKPQLYQELWDSIENMSKYSIENSLKHFFQDMIKTIHQPTQKWNKEQVRQQWKRAEQVKKTSTYRSMFCKHPRCLSYANLKKESFMVSCCFDNKETCTKIPSWTI